MTPKTPGIDILTILSVHYLLCVLMKLHILSDVHVEFESYDAPETDADVVVLAGDINVGRNGFDWAREHLRFKG